MSQFNAGLLISFNHEHLSTSALHNLKVHFAALMVNYGISNTIVLETP